MNKMKIFPKTFIYTLGLMLFIVCIAHGLIYLFTKPVPISLTQNLTDELYISADLNIADYVTQSVLKALPLSLICCVLISICCAGLFSRKFTVPIKQIGITTEQMAQLKKDAVCNVNSKDEIGTLAENINYLYRSLLSTIDELELEQQRVIDSEKSKADFLRAASHELKTPVTALNATLENMILGVGKYKEHDTYLPECKELTEHLACMIHDILEASKADISIRNENKTEIDIAELLYSVCEPYILIAKTKGIAFDMKLQNSFSVVLPQRMFEKAISNILANCVAYTGAGKGISVCLDNHNIIIENECTPIPPENLQHIFEPFYRPDYARNRDNGGNGLGLYIVDTFLKTMAISYSFCPMEEQRGMRFTINF